jgi:hypothetical protein
LAHGGLHLGHAIHRRGHGVYRQAEIFDARFNSQTARDRNSGARAGPPGGARLRYGTPSLPADLPEPMKVAAKLSHYAFYVLMIGMPLIG